MNSTAIIPANYFIVIQYYMTIYFLTIIFVFGNVGNILNIIVFSQKLLRTNGCSWYFIVFSIGNLIILYFGCCTRIVSVWTGYDLQRVSLYFCKLRIYFVLLGLNFSRNFLGLISIDRWMVTSRDAGIRRLSSRKTAYLLCLITILFWTILNINVIIGYKIDINSNCVRSTDSSYVIVYTIFALFSITCPLSIMIIFSILAIFNVQKLLHRQVYPVCVIHSNLAVQRRQHRRKDLALIKLSLVQVTVYIIFNLLDMYNTIYGFTSMNYVETTQRMAIDGFIRTLSIYLLYFYCATTFWLYILTTNTFRKECIIAWKRFIQRLKLLF